MLIRKGSGKMEFIREVAPQQCAPQEWPYLAYNVSMSSDECNSQLNHMIESTDMNRESAPGGKNARQKKKLRPFSFSRGYSPVAKTLRLLHELEGEAVTDAKTEKGGSSQPQCIRKKRLRRQHQMDLQLRRELSLYIKQTVNI